MNKFENGILKFVEIVFTVGMLFGWLFFIPFALLGALVRQLTKRAVDGAKYCPECGQGVVGFLGKCEICGYNPPRN